MSNDQRAYPEPEYQDSRGGTSTRWVIVTTPWWAKGRMGHPTRLAGWDTCNPKVGYSQMQWCECSHGGVEW